MFNSPYHHSSARQFCIPSLCFGSPKTELFLIDAEVVALAQSGDHEAFSELYLRHKERVFSICLRAVKDVSLAEDLTQETFLQLHRKIASFRDESAFATWLHRMAVNTVLMHFRKRTLLLVSLDQLTSDDVHDDRTKREFGVKDLRQCGAIDRLTIQRAVAELPPGYRAVFEFHDMQGFKHHEIARKMKFSIGCSKSQLNQARKTLRRTLDPKSK